MSEFLTPDEVRDLTQYARRELQTRELEALGLPYMVKGRRVLVSRHHVRERLAGRPVAASKAPNMEAIR